MQRNLRGDFGDRTILPLREHSGVIRIRSKPSTTEEAAVLLVPFLASARAEDLNNHLVSLTVTHSQYSHRVVTGTRD